MLDFGVPMRRHASTAVPQQQNACMAVVNANRK